MDGDSKITDPERELLVSKLFHTLDTHHDGYITFEELETYLYHNVFMDVYPKIFKPDRERLSKLFRTLDTHNDGYITFEELETYLSHSGQHFTRDDIKVLINKCDTMTKDGVLDWGEFMRFMINHEEKMWKHFVKLDRDGTGQVSYSELKYYCKKEHLDIPEQKLHELITRLDKDGNLLISWDEFREFNQFRMVFEIASKHYYGDPYSDGIVGIPSKEKEFEHAEKLLCGGIAGVVSRTATAPLDRIKVLLQVQGQQKIMGSSQDLNIKQLIRLMSNEGYLSMWRGNGISCLKVFPENAIRFFLFDYLCDADMLKFSQYNFVNQLISGGLTGITVQSMMFPVELTKTRVMTAQGSVGIIGTIREVAQENGKRLGITNFYKGMAPALIGVIPFAALQLGLSKRGTELYSDWNEVSRPGFWPLLGISSAATLVAMGCTYPLQLTKCQMQAYKGPESGRPRLVPLFRKIWRKDGVKGFYRGFSANAMKAVPASAIGWTVFSKSQKMYEQWFR